MLVNNYRISLIAEIGINGNGDLPTVFKLIDVAAELGWDVVKFQKRHISETYTQEELDSYRESLWGTTFREQKEGLEFSIEDYEKIDIHAQKRSISWTASPWDIQSLNFLVRNFKLPYIKIPSALVTNYDYLLECCGTGLPLHVSTGMSDMRLIEKVVNTIIMNNGKIECLYHCTSTYPSKPEELNLFAIPILQSAFPSIHIGYSGHEKGISTSVMAAVLGARAIERHVTLDRAMYGSDQSASLEPKGMATLIRDVRTWEKAKGDGRIKVYDSELPIIKKLRKVKNLPDTD